MTCGGKLILQTQAIISSFWLAFACGPVNSSDHDTTTGEGVADYTYAHTSGVPLEASPVPAGSFQLADQIMAKVDGCASRFSKVYSYGSQTIRLYKGDRGCKGKILQFQLGGEHFSLNQESDFATALGSYTTFQGSAGGTATIEVISQLPEVIAHGNESFAVKMIQLQKASTLTLTIEQNIFTLMADVTTVREGTDSQVSFTVKRVTKKTANKPVTVTLTYAGDAVSGVDYSGKVTSVRFEPTQDEKLITLGLIDNHDFEQDKVLTITIADSSHYSDYGQLNILFKDDDALPAYDHLTLWLSSTFGVRSKSGVKLDEWSDQSLSQRHAIQTVNGYRPRIYPNVFGQERGIRFEESDNFLQINASGGLPTQAPGRQQTIAMVFRSYADISTWQMLFQQGDANRGANIYLYQGKVYFVAWNRIQEGADSSTPWGITYGSLPVTPQTPYQLLAEFDQVSNRLNLQLNAATIVVSGIGAYYGYGGQIILGNSPSAGSTHRHDGVSGVKAQNFTGALGAVLIYDVLLAPTERDQLRQILSQTFSML